MKNEERIIVQDYYRENGKYVWKPKVTVYYRSDPPTNITPAKIGLPEIPSEWEPLEIEDKNKGPEEFSRVKKLMGNQGLVGVGLASSCALHNEEEVFSYYDNPDKHEEWAAERIEKMERRFKLIMHMEEKPDFLCVGGSGTLICQTPEIFRQLAFPAVRKAIELAKEAEIPTHVHSCGPEKELVKIMAEETDLTVIDPLEIPPMGDCDLKELKKLYGDKIILKGNLHTTDVMLRGSREDVIEASKKAIDDAASGGRFILSTGDQCGRDTPFENLFAMVETARTYGKY
jgi:uroporphyrinogen decarboxylase